MAALKAEGIVPVADIVINHRCADEKDEHTGVYNRFRWAAARWRLGVQPGSRDQPLDISQRKSAEACRCPTCYLVRLPAYSCKGNAPCHCCGMRRQCAAYKGPILVLLACRFEQGS